MSVLLTSLSTVQKAPGQHANDQPQPGRTRVDKGQRRELEAVIDRVHGWVIAATRIRFLTAHMPLSGDVAVEDSLSANLNTLTGPAPSQDVAHARPLTRAKWGHGRQKYEPARAAAARLTAYYTGFERDGWAKQLTRAETKYAKDHARERERLQRELVRLRELSDFASRALSYDAHRPIPLEDKVILTPDQIEEANRIISTVSAYHAAASMLLAPDFCGRAACESNHAAARILHDLYREVGRKAGLRRWEDHADQAGRQAEHERQQLRKLYDQVGTWDDEIRAARKRGPQASARAKTRAKAIASRSVELSFGEAQIALLPITEDDRQLLADLATARDAALSAAEEALIRKAKDFAGRFRHTVRQTFDKNWLCRGDDSCLVAHRATPAAVQEARTLKSALSDLVTPPVEASVSFDGLLDPALGLGDLLPRALTPVQLIDPELTARANAGVGAVLNAESGATTAAAAAKAAAESVRARDIATSLKAMDLDVLKKASTTSIRVAPLAGAGLTNVWDVFQYCEHNSLEFLPGLGESSAFAITQAAMRLHSALREETPVRIDVKARSKRTTALLEALRHWDALRRFAPTPDEVELAVGLQLLCDLPFPPTCVVVGATPGVDLPDVGQVLDQMLSRVGLVGSDGDIWIDFLQRPADYFGMLTELGFVTEDEASMHGDLPEEIIEAVRAKELKREFLKASLRAYQSFGARFALVQEKVVIGDEMGLGKTVEALAVLTHLRATGQTHFLVVCPAAVVSNWIRETTKHTSLPAFRLHGPQWERELAVKSWLRNGGVAVTTYDLLAWTQELLPDTDLDCAIFDEAHYIKNPSAKRSLVSAEIIDSVRFAVLMTGTPLENSVQEFRNLIGYIRPDLADSAPEFLPSMFRKHVAPAYLRRNQEDVLTELPELVEVDDWMGMSAEEERVYRRAVHEGQFMLMRRAALLAERSMKVDRLLEIVSEAEANGRRVIVFSYFRDVLEHLADRLPGEVFGPLTGSLPARDRQTLVDKFSAASEGAVLVAQITAGGVGLNIQSASVVVICEPQIKPTMESQAIARAHRMGQAETVQVHRLLTENSVDERIRDILAEKRQIFDEFARDSVIASQAPDALDMSDAEIARVVIAAERERIFGSPAPPD